jgi:hypothetical protein
MALGNDIIYLIDTPGFDDHVKGDAGILEQVASYLAIQYNHGQLLTGVLYLHPINETRVKASTRLNLEMFESLCGVTTFSNVILVSTMWDTVPKELGVRRESQMMARNEFWGTMIAQGASVARHTRTLQSGVQILSRLVNKSAVVLDIQRQIIDEKKNLNNTPAGRILRKQLLEQEEIHKKELADLRVDLDKTVKGREKLQKRVTEIEDDMKNLNIEKNRLLGTQEKIADYEKQIKILQDKAGSNWGTYAGVGVVSAAVGVGAAILLAPAAVVAAPVVGVGGAAALLAGELGAALSGLVASFAAAPAAAAGAGTILAGFTAAEVAAGAGAAALGALAVAHQR